MKAKDDLCHMCKFKKKNKPSFWSRTFHGYNIALKKRESLQWSSRLTVKFRGTVSANWKHKLWIAGWIWPGSMDDTPEPSSSHVQSIWVLERSCLSKDQCPATAFPLEWGCSCFLSEVPWPGKIWVGGKRHLEMFDLKVSALELKQCHIQACESTKRGSFPP